jgi:hypothetical protein
MGDHIRLWISAGCPGLLGTLVGIQIVSISTFNKPATLNAAAAAEVRVHPSPLSACVHQCTYRNSSSVT